MAGSKSLRYAAFLETPLRLGAVLFLEHATRRWLGRRLAPAGMVGALAILAGLDLWAFRAVFVDGGTYDPVSYNLLVWRGFIPG